MLRHPWNIIGNFIVWRAASRVIGSALFVVFMAVAFTLHGGAQRLFIEALLAACGLTIVLAGCAFAVGAVRFLADSRPQPIVNRFDRPRSARLRPIAARTVRRRASAG